MVNKTRIKNTAENYDAGGLVVITILMAISIFLLVIFWGNQPVTWENFKTFFMDMGMEVIFFAFFIVVGIYCWYSYFQNVVRKPKEDILYLKEIYNENVLLFVDPKGNVLMKTVRFNMFDKKKSITFEEGKYYKVLRHKNTVAKIIGLSSKKFVANKVKQSYWLNWYSPMGAFENIMLLPILYVIAAPGVISIFLSEGFDKIWGLLYSAFPVYLIIYDAIYKMKDRNKNS